MRAWPGHLGQRLLHRFLFRVHSGQLSGFSERPGRPRLRGGASGSTASSSSSPNGHAGWQSDGAAPGASLGGGGAFFRYGVGRVGGRTRLWRQHLEQPPYRSYSAAEKSAAALEACSRRCPGLVSQRGPAGASHRGLRSLPRRDTSSWRAALRSLPATLARGLLSGQNATTADEGTPADRPDQPGPPRKLIPRSSTPDFGFCVCGVQS